MSAINTIKGAFCKEYSVVYKEKLHNGLWFYVIQRYNDKYDKKDHHRESSEIYIDAIITQGSINTWGNSVISYSEAESCQDKLKSENFDVIDEQEYKTKQGFSYSNVVYGKYEYTVKVKDKNGKEKTEKRKSLKTKWIIIVPKNNLLKLCLK